MISLLLSRGAKVNMQTDEGATDLVLRVKWGSEISLNFFESREY